MMCFLLNERTRELCGEGYRWEDLARTKTLDARWHAFNDGVSRGIGEFNPDKHYYRPIPQSFLDGITNESGAALTNEENKQCRILAINQNLIFPYNLRDAFQKREASLFIQIYSNMYNTPVTKTEAFPYFVK